MKNNIFKSFPFAIFHFNKHNELLKMNDHAKSLTSFLDLTYLELVLKDENLANVPYWASSNCPILYFKVFKIGGTTECLVLVGERPEFWYDVPFVFEQWSEDFPSDAEEVTRKIAHLISEAITFHTVVGPRERKR